MKSINKLEVLAPVGDQERLDAALDFGADAVYLGGEQFGMRAGPANFSSEGLMSAVKKAHSKNVKVYLTCNTLPSNTEISGFEKFINNATAAEVDAVIVSDIGVLSLVKRFAPDMEIHISTQAGIVNYVTANEFYNMGAKRVVLARELSLEEISEIRAKTPKELDIECFVHGAMCVSFSGRCLLSQYLVNRDANRGECAQPCRWGYHLMEEKREGQFFPVFEDEKGTYILNSKDMCMIRHIDKLADAGVCSLKIEGRAKSSYYVSVITNAYRIAVDYYLSHGTLEGCPEWVFDEVFKVSHRAYCTGFFFGHPNDPSGDYQYYGDNGYIREYDVVGVVDSCDGKRIYCTQRNKFCRGDELEILSPGKQPVTLIADKIYDENGAELETANHATMKFSLDCDMSFVKNSIIRMKKQT